MALLIDLFGYLSVVIHGLTIIGQSMMIGAVIFLVFLARPFASELGDVGVVIRDRVCRVGLWAAAALILSETATIFLQGSVLMGTVDLSLADVLSAGFAVAAQIKIVCALVLIVVFTRFGASVPAALLLALIGCEIAAATLTTHAVARLDYRLPLAIFEGLHQLGAAIWIGGIPCFLVALNRCERGDQWRRVGKRFSQISLVGVACIVLSALVMSWVYIGDPAGLYGTAFGVMVFAKTMMFAGLLVLGGMNYLTVERLRADPGTSINRMKRFAEVEIGVGFTIFFAAASLTSVPPAVDLTSDRVTWSAIVERNTPRFPSLVSPDHSALAIPELQQKLDLEAIHDKAGAAPPAFIPGAGYLPPRNASDIAWSEYNHHWAGLIVTLIGLLAVMNRAGLRWARHWPVLFLALGAFLFLRSDPEVWPLGSIGFWDSMRDSEVVQHRIFVVLIVGFAVFEWRVRAKELVRSKAALVFPLMTALGGALLLAHSHQISNVKEQLLIEITHTPLALAGVTAGWARWLELRLDGRPARFAGWVWPWAIFLCGVILLSYREI